MENYRQVRPLDFKAWWKRKRGMDYSRMYRCTIGKENFQKVLRAQGGKCALCDFEVSDIPGDKKKKACLDHDHQTRKIRGVLCIGCNVKLAVVEIRNSEWFERAVRYLESPCTPYSYSRKPKRTALN